MGSREFEVMLLKEVQKIKPQLMIIPFQDLVYSPRLKIPRCISRTTITQDNAFSKRTGLISKEITIYKYTTTLTFVLNETMSRDDVVDIHKYLKHNLKNTWESNRTGKEYVIKEVSEIFDVTDIELDGITERYTIEVIATVVKQQDYNIAKIEKVDMSINRR